MVALNVPKVNWSSLFLSQFTSTADPNAALILIGAATYRFIIVRIMRNEIDGTCAHTPGNWAKLPMVAIGNIGT